MITINRKNKKSRHLKGYFFLLILSGMLKVPLQASYANVIGEKDTTIILFTRSQFFNQSALQITTSACSMVPSKKPVRDDSMGEISQSFISNENLVSLKSVDGQKNTVLIGCKSQKRNSCVNKNKKLLSQQMALNCILNLPKHKMKENYGVKSI
jgi:hypothetical protein